MTDTVPTDYDAEDGWDDSNGTELCPHCEKAMGTESGYHGEVYDSTGRRYEYFHDTDHQDGPFFCPDCWGELETNRREQENETLSEFA